MVFIEVAEEVLNVLFRRPLLDALLFEVVSQKVNYLPFVKHSIAVFVVAFECLFHGVEFVLVDAVVVLVNLLHFFVLIDQVPGVVLREL